MRRLAWILAATLWSPLVAHAAFEWATWGPPSGNTSPATFSTGQGVVLTADFTDISAGVPAGAEYTASPSIAGRPNNTNPSFQRFMSGPPPYPSVLSPGTLVAKLDISGIAGASSIVWGFGDQKFQYRLELRDASGAVLSSAGVQATPYNITYAGSGLIADWNSFLVTGILYVDATHDAGGFYNQTGLTTFSNLPPETREIWLYTATGTQEAEGLQMYLGADIAPTATVLRMPWFTMVDGYLSRFIFLNSGSTAATYQIDVLTEAGNVATLKPGGSSGTLPANSQFVLNVEDFVESFSGYQRAAAVISTSAAAADISGIYNLVQPTTGAISNVSLIATGDLVTPTSTLVGPWFTLDPAYRGDFILTNTSGNEVTANVSLLNTVGTTVTPLQTALAIPANGQLAVNAAQLAAVNGGLSGGAVFQVNAPAGKVKGTYKVYSFSTGAASSTELLNPSTVAGLSTTLSVPWFSTVTGYESRFILTNRGINPAGYTISILPEAGNTITTGTLTGSIPAGGQVIIPALSVVTATSGATRAGAVFNVQGPPSDIDGIYQIVSLGTGAISNTVMARPATSGAGSATLRLPWFSSVGGYISRFVLINRGNAPAAFTIEIVPEQGNAVLQQIITAGVIPALGQLVLPVAEVVTGFTASTRAAAIVRITAPAAEVDAFYNIVNADSGSISNTLMLH